MEKILKRVDLLSPGNRCPSNCRLSLVIIKSLGTCESAHMAFSDRLCIYKLKHVHNFWNTDKKTKSSFCIVSVDFKLTLFLGFMGFPSAVSAFSDLFAEKLASKF